MRSTGRSGGGPTIAPYGSWRSPITADVVASGGVALREVRLDGPDILWLEGRSAERGRSAVVRRSPDGRRADVTPPDVNVRNRVHEYGGAAYLAAGGAVWFSNFGDGRLYRAGESSGDPPVAVTPQGAWRYADAVLDRTRQRFIAVREDHTPATLAEHGEARNELVAIPLAAGTEPVVLATGRDFYAAPRLSPDGAHLAWLAWSHPNMPWDATELWVGELGADGGIVGARRVAGDGDRDGAESICQPRWSPAGVLHFITDRSGWWNLERLADPGVAAAGRQAVLPMEAELCGPDWTFGQATYGFTADGTILAVAHRDSRDHLVRIEPGAAEPEALDVPAIQIHSLQVGEGLAVFVAGMPDAPAAVVALDLDSGTLETLRTARDVAIDPAFISIAEPIAFASTDGRTAYGLYYAPRNPGFVAPDGERPPLAVRSHGGPTASASSALDMEIQFFTSRGIAFLDVDYGGSTGYGRAYRHLLDGQWGVVDVDDCVNGALALVERGLADRERLAVSGGSAGGYTTLAAVAFRDAFSAGVSSYGIGDLETFVHQTHKFESRYVDRLVGPYPEAADRYRERSPLNFPDRICCPMLILQGLDDRIVPPAQAEQIVASLRARGLPHAYLAFEGEDHGFRQASSIRRSLEAELSFYGQVFGFEPADEIEPLRVENLAPGR